MAKKAAEAVTAYLQERTDHSEQIETLRETAETHKEHGLISSSVIYNAAADLLEVHDATGISLDDFGAVKELVEFALRDLGLDPFTPNGV